jgi:hypothetical protein
MGGNFERIEHLPGVLFTNFGPSEAKDGEFLQKLDSEWARFEHFWQFRSHRHSGARCWAAA